MNDHAVPFQPLTETQRRELERDLPSSMVKQRQAGRDGSVSYLEGWQVLETANDIFGPDGWSYELVGDVRQVYEGQKKGRDGGENRVIVFEARVRVRVGASVREDVGSDTCDVPDRADALAQGIDKARKGAVTDAVKRALRTYGHVLGLALYDKSRRRIGASLECQRLLDEIEVCSIENLDPWCHEHADAIRRLPESEQRSLHDAVVGRRREIEKAQARASRQQERAQQQPESPAPTTQAPQNAAPSPQPAPANNTQPSRESSPPVPPRTQAPAPQSPPGLAQYRARIAEVPTIDVLVAATVELEPSVSTCKEAAWSVACARAAELGYDAEWLGSAYDKACAICPDPSAWRTVGAYLTALALSVDGAAVEKVTKDQAAALSKLPNELKTRMATALKRRRQEVSIPNTPAGHLERQLRDAKDIPAIEAVGDIVTTAYTLGDITAEQVTSLTKLQNELALAMEREVAA